MPRTTTVGDPRVSVGATFSCPLDSVSGFRWPKVAPLPGFPDPGRAYFSIPFSGWYLPVSDASSIGPWIVGEVPESAVPKFEGMLIHEQGHGALAQLVANQVIRYHLGRAYYGVSQLTSPPTNGEGVFRALKASEDIAVITIDVEFVQELF